MQVAVADNDPNQMNNGNIGSPSYPNYTQNPVNYPPSYNNSGPVNYGVPNYGVPNQNQPSYGVPNYGAPNYGAPNYGTPAYLQQGPVVN